MSSRVQEEENDTMRMREIDVHDYARQLLEAHGGRDRHAVHDAHAHGRQSDALQVRDQKRRSQEWHDRDVHAEAPV
jgi:hypothetical protein